MTSQTFFLTGFTGYLGSHLLQYLTRLGIKVVCIGRQGETYNFQEKNISCVYWNSVDELTHQLRGLHNPILINIAGYFINKHSTENLDELIESNFNFPLRIFDALARADINNIVNIGTSWEFNAQGERKPANLYAQLKSANAESLNWYAREYRLRVINLKLNDTFGGIDNRAKLMPYLKKCCNTGVAARLRLSAQPVNFLHIHDVQAALVHAAFLTNQILPGNPETMFLFSDETVSMGELLKKISRNGSTKLRYSFSNNIENAKITNNIWDEAPKLVNWKPKLSLDNGIKEYFGE